jgi:hypothetical protein
VQRLGCCKVRHFSGVRHSVVGYVISIIEYFYIALSLLHSIDLNRLSISRDIDFRNLA